MFQFRCLCCLFTVLEQEAYFGLFFFRIIFTLSCSVEVLPFDPDLVHEALQEDFEEIYDDEDDSNGW